MMHWSPRNPIASRHPPSRDGGPLLRTTPNQRAVADGWGPFVAGEAAPFSRRAASRSRCALGGCWREEKGWRRAWADAIGTRMEAAAAPRRPVGSAGRSRLEGRWGPFDGARHLGSNGWRQPRGKRGRRQRQRQRWLGSRSAAARDAGRARSIEADRSRSSLPTNPQVVLTGCLFGEDHG